MASPNLSETAMKNSALTLSSTVLFLLLLNSAVGFKTPTEGNSTRAIDLSMSSHSAAQFQEASIQKLIVPAHRDPEPSLMNAKSGNSPVISDNLSLKQSSDVPSAVNSTSKAEGMVHPVDTSNELPKKFDPEALMRAFYVFVGCGTIVMVYLAWKSLSKRPTEVHRYGVVANREDLEMAPLDSDDGDEDDTTHFDISSHRLK